MQSERKRCDIFRQCGDQGTLLDCSGMGKDNVNPKRLIPRDSLPRDDNNAISCKTSRHSLCPHSGVYLGPNSGDDSL